MNHTAAFADTQPPQPSQKARIQQVWELIREFPDSTAADIASVLDVPNVNITSAFSNLESRRMIDAVFKYGKDKNGQPRLMKHYSTTLNTFVLYPKTTRVFRKLPSSPYSGVTPPAPVVAKKAAPAPQQPALFTIPPATFSNPVVTMPTPAPQPAPAPAPVPNIVAGFPLRMNDEQIGQFIDGLSLAEARALYVRLGAIFGGK